MAYGKIKADAIIYDDSGSDVEKTIAVLAAAAPTASPTFTGDVTLTGAAANVVFDASDNALEFAQDAKADFNGILKIYRDSSNSYITNSNSNLFLKGDQVNIRSSSNEQMIETVGNGSVSLYHDNSKKIETTAAGVTVSGSVTDDKGDLRSIPQASKTATHTLVAADAGKHINTNSSVTIPPSVFSAGHAITVYNNSGVDIPIYRGTGVTLYQASDGANANRTLGTKGLATILCVASDTFVISGAGLS